MGGRNLRVLVVDDDERFRALVATLLESAGYEVVGTASDGAEGVSLCERLAPDAVTMDLEMPVLDGVAATAAITEGPAAPVVVIVSGSASSEKLEDALSSGAFAHVPKRRAPELLVETLERALAATRA